jgi:putative membrane protein
MARSKLDMKAFEKVGKYKELLLLGILLIFYAVGTVGILSDQRDWFLSLSPFNLLLSFVCLLLSYKRLSFSLGITIFIAAGIGFLAELIGVHTGFLFGDYWYGENLGTKLFEVPLIIGVNWAMLSLISTAFFLNSKQSIWVKALFSASVMTALDVIMEPVAMQSDFWQWAGGQIPIYNYVCWWVIGYLVHLILYKHRLHEQNKVSVGLFFILILFFLILNWL